MALVADQMKRLVSLHGWIAVALSVLLYIVMLTGTIAVFDNEIQSWSEGRTAEKSAFDYELDPIYRQIAQQVPKELHSEMFIANGPGQTLRMNFTGPVKLRDGTTETFARSYLVNPENGTIVQSRGGRLADMDFHDPADALAHFIVDLHVRLHVPGRIGLYLTGILGVAMLIAAITGVLIHRNIIREMFVTERPGKRVVSVRDRHNLAGVWSLPFAVVLSFTGAFLSFALTLGLPVVAMVAFGGDQQKAIDAATPRPIAIDATPAEMRNIDEIMSIARAQVGTDVVAINIKNGGRADAVIATSHPRPTGSLLGQSPQYGGATGEYLGDALVVGNAPSAGSVLVDLVAPLHFGNFAGLPSKIVWGALGAAMTFTIVTGMQLWFRRRVDDPVWRAGNYVFTASVWLTPLALVGAAYGYFLAFLGADLESWTIQGCFTGLGLCAAMLVIWRHKPLAIVERNLALSLGATLAFLPFLRLQTGGLSWGEAFTMGGGDTLLMDFLCIVGGAIFLYVWWQEPDLSEPEPKQKKRERKPVAPLAPTAAE